MTYFKCSDCSYTGEMNYSHIGNGLTCGKCDSKKIKTIKTKPVSVKCKKEGFMSFFFITSINKESVNSFNHNSL